ncbi:MAG: trypsin-like serine protease, partial [Myxococcota bacterium]
MKVKNLALALALASVACGGEPEFESELSRESEEVINGVPATDAQSGLQGALFVRPGLFRRFQCGATYLGENSEGEHWVLTAAHCVDDVSGPMWVGFGRSNRNSYRAADLISVDQIKIHGNYDLATIVNDIAVVRLVERPTRAQVVDLAEESAPRFTGAVAEIVGFGRGTNGPL